MKRLAATAVFLGALVFCYIRFRGLLHEERPPAQPGNKPAAAAPAAVPANAGPGVPETAVPVVAAAEPPAVVPAPEAPAPAPAVNTYQAAQRLRELLSNSSSVPPDMWTGEVNPLAALLAEHDPSAGVGILNGLKDGWASQFFCTGFCSTLIQRHGVKVAFDYLRPFFTRTNADARKLRASALYEVMNAWGATDTKAALGAARTLPDPAGSQAQELVLAAWGETDPRAALRAAAGLKAPGRSAAVAEQIFTSWRSRDFESALNTLMGDPSLVPVEIAQRALGDAFETRSSQDAPDAAQKALMLGGISAELRNNMLSRVMANWIPLDPVKSLNWLSEAAIDGNSYDKVLLAAVTDTANRNPMVAAGVLQDFIIAGRLDEESDPAVYEQAVKAAKQIGVSWGVADFERALAWGLSLPEGPIRAYVLSNVAYSESWSADKPDSVNWAFDLPPGFTRARVAAAYAYGKLLAPGEGGNRALGEQIKSQLDRDELEPATIQALVLESPLTAEEKDAIFRLLRGAQLQPEE